LATIDDELGVAMRRHPPVHLKRRRWQRPGSCFPCWGPRVVPVEPRPRQRQSPLDPRLHITSGHQHLQHQHLQHQNDLRDAWRKPRSATECAAAIPQGGRRGEGREGRGVLPCRIGTACLVSYLWLPLAMRSCLRLNTVQRTANAKGGDQEQNHNGVRLECIHSTNRTLLRLPPCLLPRPLTSWD
jgi:hypothetical protein